MVDPSLVDTRLGGEEGRRALVEASSARGIGIVVDLVPNHMAVSLPSNRWFWEVLEHGPSSRYAGHFDVDWNPPESGIHDKVLMPILGDHYGRELESGAIRLERDGGQFRVRYHDHVLPASPTSVGVVLERAAAGVDSDRLAFVAHSLTRLPPAAATDEASRRRRHADAAVLGDMVNDLMSVTDLAGAVDEVLDRVNRDPEDLDGLLDMQNYRLARWRVTGHELGYRRFFDIDTLIGLRVEDPETFEDAHELVLAWVEAGEVDGLRIDHPDGLRRPGQYLRRLRKEAPQAWIVVEKILEGAETLPESWPVDGTTGYDFLIDVTTLFVDPAGQEPLTHLWEEVAGSTAVWERVRDEAKRQVLAEILAGDVNRLTSVFADVVENRRRYRDFTRAELAEGLSEALVAFDVYRTYVSEEGDAAPVDRRRIETAIGVARERRHDLDPELFQLLQAVLVADLDGDREAELRMRFQQLTGPVMAKGVEDTAFYRYLRLASLCEVGGDPSRFGFDDVAEFHRRRQIAHQGWPTTMLALSTHDTKRSEDVRARLAVLSEIPQRWESTVQRWHRHTRRYRPRLLDGPTEYLIYQTLVGAHPLDLDRLLAYLEKATKEAKTHTSWTDPHPAYDEAVQVFARRIHDDSEFQQDLARFVRPVIAVGRINSLAQKAIQLTAPGVPDLYQGSELWDLSLVDPDNRRRVDYERRRRMLSELTASPPTPAEAMERMDEGFAKLWLVHSLLNLRRRQLAALGPEGAYEPLMVDGPTALHAVAYLRGERVAVVVPRLGVGLVRAGGWADTTIRLPDGEWVDVFTGLHHDGPTPAARLLADFPVAVLERR